MVINYFFGNKNREKAIISKFKNSSVYVKISKISFPNRKLTISSLSLKFIRTSPGQVAQLLVRALSPYIKVEGSTPGQGMHRKQPVNAS